MTKNPLIVIIILLIIVGCSKNQNPYLISSKSIGLLNDSTQVNDLKAIFNNDSIVFRNEEQEFIGNRNDIEIFDSSGNSLLVLTPSISMDSTSTIKTIKIVDPRFKTVKGLNTTSTFGDVKNNYTISSIQNTLKNIVVFVNEIDAFITIDKKELPSELQFDMTTTIEATQIPEKAKIKYFMIGW